MILDQAHCLTPKGTNNHGLKVSCKIDYMMSMKRVWYIYLQLVDKIIQLDNSHTSVDLFPF